MFELEVAIRDWRERLTESLRDGDLDELEGHLREEITQLCTQGLSTEDAFVIGTRRLGGEHELCGEFAKVHPRAAAVRQFQWMIIGFLEISVLLSAFRALSLLAIGAEAGSGGDTNLAFGLLGLVPAAGSVPGDSARVLDLSPNRSRFHARRGYSAANPAHVSHEPKAKVIAIQTHFPGPPTSAPRAKWPTS